MGLTPGGVFGGYLIERRLGVGGMGAVYAARHPRLPRRVALKVLGEHLSSDPEFRARFEREAELAARVDHPNVVSVYDRGSEGDRLWIAMQYVDGVDAERLTKRGRSVLPSSRAVFILAEAAKGLDSAHRRGLLHRDVKPSNILVAEDSDEGDHVLVTDFGIARALDQTSALTNAGSIAATLPFASPEQIAGRELDHRSDVYSLGCTLYVMLSGSVPFPRDSQIAVMHAHLADPPPQVTLANPSLPMEMDDVIARAMAKDPDHRYRSCRELAFAAQTALSRIGGEEGPGRAATGDRDSSPSYPNTPNTLASHTNPRSRPDHAANAADTVFPASAHARRMPRRTRAVILGAAVLAGAIGLVVAGRLVFGGARSDPSPAAATSTASAEPTETHTGPWQAYDFVATALPDLVPDTPSGTSYLNGSCQAINARFEPVDQLGTPVPVARILCTPAETVQPSYVDNYVLICSSDRTPQTLAGVADGLTAVRNESWSRAGESGQTVYGDHGGAGALAVSFDSPSRNFCLIVVNGRNGTRGQDVHDHWFRDAPL